MSLRILESLVARWTADTQYPFNSAMTGWDRIIHDVLCRFLYFRDIIKQDNGEPVLYLRRYYLTHTKGKGGYFLHNIRRPDNDRHPHSHPWRFKTFCLAGGYVEHVVYDIPSDSEGEDDWIGTRKTFSRFQTLDNPAIHTHKVEKLLGPTWTLVKIWTTEREWDFLTASGRVHWREYLGLNDPKSIAGEPVYDEDVIVDPDA